MTIRDFLTLLDGGEWRLDEDGNLMDENDRCPLWHAYDEQVAYHDEDDEYPEDYCEAGLRIGLRTRDACAIAAAADGRGHPRLRKRLLESVGLAQ